MTEPISFIPSRVKNCAEGGHVAGARDIIDDGSGITLDELVGNKEYAPADFSGMGRVVLKKNIVNDVNTLTRSMMSDANTIYVIQYDFTLGEDITIPANCVLEFEGGSISAGSGENKDTITGTNTGIQAGLVKIFNTSISVGGTWNISKLYPQWFGAKGDGITDDTTAIQAALNLLDGRTLFIPTGVYIVSPPYSPYSDSYILKIPQLSKGNISGCGTSSVIKVKANVGNYRGILGTSNDASIVSNLTVQNIAFDHNAQNNIIGDVSDYALRVRATIAMYNSSLETFENIVFSSLTIFNSDSKVSIYCTGADGTGNVHISNCTWVDVQNGNGNAFDQSIINCTCGGIQILNCVFKGKSWAFSPMCAFETHASNCVISNNVITCFQSGICITGNSRHGTTLRHICVNNTIDVSRDAIIIWSAQQEGTIDPVLVGFDNMIISDNSITINPYNYNFGNVSFGFRGISFYGGSTQIDCKNCKISGNVITYVRDVEGNSYTSKSDYNYWGAICCYISTGSPLFENLNISNNTVVNCAASGIFFYNGIYSGLMIYNNFLKNCGTTTKTNANLVNKTPLYLSCKLSSDACVYNNTVLDDNDVTPLAQYIMAEDSSSVKVYKFNIKDNTFGYKDGADVSSVVNYISLGTGTRAYIKGDVPSESIKLPDYSSIVVGSQLMISDSAITAYKATNNHYFWRKSKVDTSAPTIGSWRIGDIVNNLSPSAGGYVGWVCTTNGTPGTWKGFGSIES